MFYQKNLRAKEQVIRIALGVAIAALGLVLLAGSWISLVVAGVGAVLALTGVFGFCPGCAMVGRKLDQKAAAASKASRG